MPPSASLDTADKNQQLVKDEKSQRLLDRRVFEETDRQATPAILQSGSQLYKEASSILYFGTAAGSQARGCVDDVEVGKMRVWRHLPFHGFGDKTAAYEVARGLTIYTE